MSTELQRFKITPLTTNLGSYNALDMYTSFGPFDCHYVAKVLHDMMQIDPKKALSVTYHDPFENFQNPESAHYMFIDFYWIHENNRYQQLLRRQNYLCIHRSPSEIWLIKPFGFETNLMKHSHKSITVYFTDKPQDPDYDELFHDKPFDANEEEPSIGYRDAYIHIVPKLREDKHENHDKP